MSASAAFDALAADYDREFTDTPIGRRMRNAVWRRLDARFGPGDRVLELSCGTGEDAVHLASRGIEVTATDVAPAMLAVARQKVTRAGIGDRVRLAEVSIEALDHRLGTFDGVVSNFGGLNCVSDLAAVGARLARCMRPGAVAVLCVMGPLAPWEWAWFLARADPVRAMRRLRSDGARWRGTCVRYPAIGQLRRAFAPWFGLERTSAVGSLMPPPCAASFARTYPRLVDWLDRVERRFESTWPLPHLADHYVAELRRRTSS